MVHGNIQRQEGIKEASWPIWRQSNVESAWVNTDIIAVIVGTQAETSQMKTGKDH